LTLGLAVVIRWNLRWLHRRRKKNATKRETCVASRIRTPNPVSSRVEASRSPRRPPHSTTRGAHAS